jgi:hypothetical protein
MNLIGQIERAFESRIKPLAVTPRWHADTSEYEEALRFKGLDWKGLGSAFIKQNSDALYGLTPDAFCYYLPAFLIAGAAGGSEAFYLADGIIKMLDRSPNPEYWDEFFLARWPLLKKPECLVIQNWLLALSANSLYAEGDDLSRAFDTVQLLINRMDKDSQ